MVEAMRTRLEEAMTNSEKVKLIFQYPSTKNAVIKSGYVKECFNDGFSFDEIYDGSVVYSYKYIVEIVGVKGWKSGSVPNVKEKDKPTTILFLFYVSVVNIEMK